MEVEAGILDPRLTLERTRHEGSGLMDARESKKKKKYRLQDRNTKHPESQAILNPTHQTQSLRVVLIFPQQATKTRGRCPCGPLSGVPQPGTGLEPRSQDAGSGEEPRHLQVTNWSLGVDSFSPQSPRCCAVSDLSMNRQ
jgi:hypothetical protein